jgi:hypothetical protein
LPLLVTNPRSEGSFNFRLRFQARGGNQIEAAKLLLIIIIIIASFTGNLTGKIFRSALATAGPLASFGALCSVPPHPAPPCPLPALQPFLFVLVCACVRIVRDCAILDKL